MDQEQAKKLIKNTFESAFDKNRFTLFIKNLLNSIDESKYFHAHGYVKESFQNIIKTYERIGTYKSPDGKCIDIIIVYLQKAFSIHHARVTQRNFAGKYLSDRGGKDAGLFAYVGPDEVDWRFSLVTMDYSFKETPDGKHKVVTEFSPARRWSFLVGENEKSHTAQKQLVSLLADDENNPTLAQLIEAFNIEKVSNEFFLEYRNLFIRTKEELDKIVKNDPRVKSEFLSKGVNTVDFAKKLLGQIVFLYFLQKKGWFGVARDENWGAGSKKFLRELFEKKHSNYNNFFNDILEPLFYEALRNDRSYDSHFYSRFNCKIPFLNGGLFDPIGNYDWVNTDICLPDHLFSNSFLSKQGDIGNGILDIFDRYNFTVREDEPLEKEVAIDPELLGKAYEKFNAIRPDNFAEYQEVLKSGTKGNENKFNKQYGVYYTPREIVHYMCQQSLIHFLESELNGKTVSYERVGKPNLDMFGNEIRKGQLDITIEHKDHSTIPIKDIETFIQLGEQYRENDEIALQKEKKINNGEQNSSTIKALLPESIRKNASLIDEKLANITVCDPAVGSGAFPVGMMNEIVKARNVLTPYIKDDSRTIYNYKRQCIEKTLYGVDIDPGAVEIAKLRLWLSLIVEEEDFKNIKPLPNLDYKIVCGDSLLGIERDLFNDNLFTELEKLKPLYFKETNPTNKEAYRNNINNLIHQLTNGKKIFDFEIYFSEVFHEKGGFDVVIANPPYVRQEKIKDQKPLLKKYELFNPISDLYTYFYEKGFNILKENGILTYITSNKFLRARYGKNIRNYFKTKTTIKTIINFGSRHIFEAITNTLIFVGIKANTKDNLFDYSDDIEIPNKIKFPQNELRDSEWTIAKPEIINLKNKIETVGIPLKQWKVKMNYGIKTGLNEAFIIDTPTKERLCKEDSKSAEILKPLLRGRDIEKYHYKWAGLWLISMFPVLKINIDSYPTIKKYLLSFGKEKLAQDGKKYPNGITSRKKTGNKWFETQDQIAYYKDFSEEKIIWLELTDVNKFAYSDKEDYLLAGSFLMVGESLKYLLAYLNSKLCLFNFSLICNSSGMDTIQWKKFALEKLPVKKISNNEQKPFIDLVDKILEITETDDYLENVEKQSEVREYEKQIDQMVYKLYELTPEEIKIVEGKSNK